jgi:hypothetical protein
MPRTGFLGWAYISGSSVSFDSGIADKQVLFMSGTNVVSSSNNFQYDYTANTLTLTASRQTYTSGDTGFGFPSASFDIGDTVGGTVAGATITVNDFLNSKQASLSLNPDGSSLTQTGFGADLTIKSTAGDVILNAANTIVSGTLQNTTGPFAAAAAYVLQNDIAYLKTDDANAGDVLKAGSSSDGSIAVGNVVYLDNTGTWYQASAATTGSGDAQLIGISLSNAPVTDGILTRGIYQIATSLLSSSAGAGSLDKGVQVYISPLTAGGYTTVRPTNTGEIVRVIGHSVDTNQIFFNPSPDFVEI